VGYEWRKAQEEQDQGIVEGLLRRADPTSRFEDDPAAEVGRRSCPSAAKRCKGSKGVLYGTEIKYLSISIFT